MLTAMTAKIFHRFTSLKRDKPVDVELQYRQACQKWEYHTLVGGELLSIGEYHAALDHFQQSWQVAAKQLSNEHCTAEGREIFLGYFSLAILNVSYLLELQNKTDQLEKVLSDGHFRLLGLMTNHQEADHFRHEARRQAQKLLAKLSDLLNFQGRTQVADSLWEEFGRIQLKLQ